jgi:hypothetical protein
MQVATSQCDTPLVISSFFVWFWLKFLQKISEYVNVELNWWICNLIHGQVDWAKLLAKAWNRDKIIVRGFSWERPHYCPILQQGLGNPWFHNLELSNLSSDPIIIHSFNPLTRATWLPNPPTTSFKAKPGHLFWEHLVLRLLPCIKHWQNYFVCWVFLHFVHGGATVNQHPPAHHPLDACYYSVVDEPQPS